MPSLSFTSISNRQASIVVLLMIIGIFIVYIPSLSSGFFSDDFVYIAENGNLQNSGLWDVLTKKTNPYEYLPLRDLTYWIDFRLFGLNPLPYKIDNLIWYALACLGSGYASLQIALLFSLARNDAIKLALLTSVVFSFHPLHVESVAWISGRKDLISGALVFLATGLFAQGQRSGNTTLNWMATLVFALSLMGKSTVIIFPFAALLLAYSQTSKPAIRQLLPVIAMGLIAILVFLSARSIGIAANIAPNFINDERGSVELALKITGFAFWKSIFPLDIRLVYDELHSTVKATLPLALYGGIAVVAATLVSIRWYWSKKSLFAFSLIWFLLFLIPYLQIIPFRTWAPFADRFAFLSTYSIALALGVAALRFRRIEIWLACFAVLLMFASLTILRSTEWRSIDVLLRQNAEKSYGSYIAQSLFVDSVLIPAGQYREAIEAAQHVINPNLRELLVIQIRDAQLLKTGSREERAAYLKSVFSSNQDLLLSADTQFLPELAASFLSAGLYTESETFLRTLLSRPGMKSNASVRYNLGLALAGQNRLEEAKREFESLALDGGVEPALRLLALKKLKLLAKTQ